MDEGAEAAQRGLWGPPLLRRSGPLVGVHGARRPPQLGRQGRHEVLGLPAAAVRAQGAGPRQVAQAGSEGRQVRRGRGRGRARRGARDVRDAREPEGRPRAGPLAPLSPRLASPRVPSGFRFETGAPARDVEEGVLGYKGALPVVPPAVLPAEVTERGARDVGRVEVRRVVGGPARAVGEVEPLLTRSL